MKVKIKKKIEQELDIPDESDMGKLLKVATEIGILSSYGLNEHINQYYIILKNPAIVQDFLFSKTSSLSIHFNMSFQTVKPNPKPDEKSAY